MIQLSLSLTGHLNQIHKCTQIIFFLGGGGLRVGSTVTPHPPNPRMEMYKQTVSVLQYASIYVPDIDLLELFSVSCYV